MHVEIVMQQVFISYRDKIPDVATLAPFSDNGDDFIGIDSAKFSPFSGEQITKIRANSAEVSAEDIAGIVQIGTCKCGAIHRCDVATARAMYIDPKCSGFYCIDCASIVELSINQKELFTAIAADEAGDNEPADNVSPANVTQPDKTTLIADSKGKGTLPEPVNNQAPTPDDNKVDIVKTATSDQADDSTAGDPDVIDDTQAEGNGLAADTELPPPGDVSPGSQGAVAPAPDNMDTPATDPGTVSDTPPNAPLNPDAPIAPTDDDVNDAQTMVASYIAGKMSIRPLLAMIRDNRMPESAMAQLVAEGKEEDVASVYDALIDISGDLDIAQEGQDGDSIDDGDMNSPSDVDGGAGGDSGDDDADVIDDDDDDDSDDGSDDDSSDDDDSDDDSDVIDGSDDGSDDDDDGVSGNDPTDSQDNSDDGDGDGSDDTDADVLDDDDGDDSADGDDGDNARKLDKAGAHTAKYTFTGAAKLKPRGTPFYDKQCLDNGCVHFQPGDKMTAHMGDNKKVSLHHSRGGKYLGNVHVHQASFDGLKKHLKMHDKASLVDTADLFTDKDDNPDGKTFAEIKANPMPNTDEQPNDNAKLFKLDARVNLRDADIACVLNARETAYFVFADGNPVGQLRKDMASTDNATLFDKEVFVKSFRGQLQAGKPVDRFGYAPYTIAVDTAAIREDLTKKQNADIATNLSNDYDKRIDTLKQSIVIASVAANKNVWPDFSNPVRENLVKKLDSLGFDDAAAVVDRIFAEHAQAATESVLAKSLELASKPAEVRKEIKTLVDTARYAVTVAPKGGMAEKLTRMGTLEDKTTKSPRLVTEDRAAEADTSKSKKKFDWATEGF
jgi:hypothetical protein